MARTPRVVTVAKLAAALAVISVLPTGASALGATGSGGQTISGEVVPVAGVVLGPGGAPRATANLPVEMVRSRSAAGETLTITPVPDLVAGR